VRTARLDVKAAQVRKDTAVDAARTDWLDYLPLLTAVFPAVLPRNPLRSPSR